MVYDKFTVHYDEQKNGIKNMIRNMVEGALMLIVKQGHSNIISLGDVNSLDKSTSILTTS